MREILLKAGELRIGNWVVPPETPFEPVQVTLDVLVYYGDDLIPVLLTEEWLERFGFEFKEEFSVFNDWHYPYYAKEGVVILFNKTSEDNICYKGGYAEMREGNYHAVTTRWIHHIHQLQNLYHALTGKELVRKEIEKL